MIRRAAVEIRQLHFNHDNDFLYVKKDKLTGQDTIQTNSNVQKTKDLKSMVRLYLYKGEGGLLDIKISILHVNHIAGNKPNI